MLLFGIGCQPSHHGISWNEGSNLNNVLIVLPQWIRVPARPLFILRPAKDIYPPVADLVIGRFARNGLVPYMTESASSRVQRNLLPSDHILCMTTANLRASAAPQLITARWDASRIAHLNI